MALAAAPPLLALVTIGASSACGARSQLFGLDDPIVETADAGPDALPACIIPQPSREPAPAYIEIVLDASGSMLEDGKWEAASLALGALFDEYYSRADDTVSLGLLVFAGSKDPTGGDGPYPTARDVAPGFVDATQYAALHARIAGMFPIGPTPTFPAMSGGFDVLDSYVPSPRLRTPGRRVVVLVSDGAPTAASAAGEADVEKDKTVALVADLLAASPSISTFAIGIGPFPPPSYSDYDPVFMGDIAINGGTRATRACDPKSNLIAEICHIQITPSAKRTSQEIASDMLRALHDVRSRTTDICAFDLTGDFTRFDPAQTKVTITTGGIAHTVAEDATNGWQYDSPAKPRGLVLKGSACEAILNDVSARVAMTFGCG